MEKILIKTPGTVSAILLGARWQAVRKLLPGNNAVIITDDNINGCYGSEFPDIPVLKVRPGEKSKQLEVIESLAEKLLKYGIDRSGFILAIGGGVVCDVAGFLASVYMRGIRCGFISTSLLSQVDASTGGKNAVNLGEVKNLIGSFRQPEFVICDTTMLRTLPEGEYLSGLAELIKTGVIGDPSIIDILENNQSGIIRRERTLLDNLIARSVKYKARIVSRDEREEGPRRVLNFGHTFGHAIELHERVRHGFAVASGMELAVIYSVKKGYLDTEVGERIIELMRKYGLLRKYKMTVPAMRRLILHDKKKTGSMIYFVFIKGIGKPSVEKIAIKELIDFYRQIK